MATSAASTLARINDSPVILPRREGSATAHVDEIAVVTCEELADAAETGGDAFSRAAAVVFRAAAEPKPMIGAEFDPDLSAGPLLMN